MQAWEEKLLERQKEKRELLRRMNHKMSIEEIADVLDMDVPQNINKIVALNRVVTNWEYQLGVNPELIHPTKEMVFAKFTKLL